MASARAVERAREGRQAVAVAPVAPLADGRCSPGPGRSCRGSRCAGGSSRRARRSAACACPARRSRGAARDRVGRRFLGRLFGGPFFLGLLPAIGAGGGAMPPGCAEAARPSSAPAPRRGERQRQGEHAGARRRAVWRILSTSITNGLRAELEQHAAGRGRVQERDLMAARARARRLVDQPDAGRLEGRQRRRRDPRPRSRRGAARARGGQEARAARVAGRPAGAQISRAASVARRRARVAETATSVAWFATCSRAPATRPNSAAALRAAASRSPTAMAT